MQENKIGNLLLAAINPYIEKNTISNKEEKVSGKDFVSWGDGNKYPQFLLDLYNNCTTLQTIINGTSDYVTGDDIVCNINGFERRVNTKGETIKDIIQKITMDYLIFGSFALQIIRDYKGSVSEIYWIDVNKLRSDEKNEVFFYSEDWNKSYGRVKTLKYPKYQPYDTNPSSIYFFKGNKSRNVYGQPIWGAAVKNAQIETQITDFHLNELNNNFMTSKLISFNNGTPSDEQKLEIEKNLNEKFSGTENSGRVMIAFSESKENAPEIMDLGTDNFADRYNTLAKRNKEEIYCAFRATPLLFGLVSESNGFSTSEYSDSFQLFNKTVVAPIQQAIVGAFDKIFVQSNSVTISPFVITFENKE